MDNHTRALPYDLEEKSIKFVIKEKRITQNVRTQPKGGLLCDVAVRDWWYPSQK